MVETNPAGFGANSPVPLGLRPAGAHFVIRLARCSSIALRRLPRGSPRRAANIIASIWSLYALRATAILRVLNESENARLSKNIRESPLSLWPGFLSNAYLALTFSALE